MIDIIYVIESRPPEDPPLFPWLGGPTKSRGSTLWAPDLVARKGHVGCTSGGVCQVDKGVGGVYGFGRGPTLKDSSVLVKHLTASCCSEE